MLVDLATERHRPRCPNSGRVRVPQFMDVEGYSHVQHIVSKVQGRLAVGPASASTPSRPFSRPGRCPARRSRARWRSSRSWSGGAGPYAGGVGYLSFDGNLDSAITIRSPCERRGRAYCRRGRASSPTRTRPRVRGDRAEAGAMRASLERCALSHEGG